MSLPFLRKKDAAVSTIMNIDRKPDEDKAEASESASPAMKAAAEDILRAIETKDAEHLALAIQAAFEIADSAPHVEGEHINESEE